MGQLWNQACENAKNEMDDEHNDYLPEPQAAEPEEHDDQVVNGVAARASNDNSKPLLPHHRQELHESGWTDDTIAKLGVYSTEDAAHIVALLNWTDDRAAERAAALGPCLVIPYPNVLGYAKLKPDNPRLTGAAPNKHEFSDAAGHNYGHVAPEDMRKPIKYESPRDQPAHIYAPELLCPALLDVNEDLDITEGEKKTAVACQEGRPTLGLPGVANAHDLEARKRADDWGGRSFVLTPEAARYVMPGRVCNIVFDSPDTVENVQVIRAAVRLARMIADRDAKPRMAYLPNVCKGKTGLDDWFMHEKDECGEEYKPFDYDVGDPRPVAPNELIEWLVEEQADNGDGPKLRTDVRRAVTWSRVWFERDHRAYRRWLKDLCKKLRLEPDPTAALADHLGLSVDDAGDVGAFKHFDDAMILKHCVPVLDEHFVLHRAADGTGRTFFVNERREVTLLLTDDHQRQLLHDKLKEMFGELPPESLLMKALVLWKKETKVITEEPAAFTFDGDDRLTFKRFSWTPIAGPFPAWDEFLNRLTDRDAFQAFVWSCFEPQNMSRQYLWLRGEGQDGKSRVLQTLQDLFGVAGAGITNTTVKAGNQFTNSALYGKRLVVYSDCKNSKFGMTEYVRNWTSGDPVMVEFKGKTPFTCRFYLKLIVASNPKPEFTGQAADISRVIYQEVSESLSKDDPAWPARLTEELPTFLYACREAYERLCPHHGDIRLSAGLKTLQSDAVIAFEERYHDIFDTHCLVEPGARTQARDLSARLDRERVGNTEKAEFKRWLEREKSITHRATNKARFYENLRLKPLLDAVLGTE